MKKDVIVAIAEASQGHKTTEEGMMEMNKDIPLEGDIVPLEDYMKVETS